MDEEDKAEALACMERRRNGAKETLQVRYVTKGSGYVWACINANPIFDEHGAYKGALAMVTDITEQLKAEQYLKESEANLRTVFENTDTGFVLYNQDFDIIAFNSKADSYYRLHFNKQIQTGLSGLLFKPDEKQDEIDHILTAVKNGEILSYPVSHEPVNDMVKWHDIKWVGVFNANNEHIGALLTIKDITESKLLELEREKITADLVERNKDQEQFNYMLSHSLRAPVANVNALIILLQDQDLIEEEKNYILNGILTSVKNMDAVITEMNKVLDLKKMVKPD
jgi:PAS domain-containing protein